MAYILGIHTYICVRAILYIILYAIIFVVRSLSFSSACTGAFTFQSLAGIPQIAGAWWHRPSAGDTSYMYEYRYRVMAVRFVGAA